MGDEEKIFKCNTHHTTFNNAIRSLRYKGTFTDVTLACNGKLYPLHKFVLAICSEYFSKILESTDCANPVIILTGIQCSDMELLIDYMYTGEVNVRKDKMSSFIKAAQSIRINRLELQNEEPKSYSNEQDEEYLLTEIKLENTEGVKDMSISDEVENVSDTGHYLASDISDHLETMKEDDPLSISDYEYDDSDLPCTPRKETDTTYCVRYNSSITEFLSDAVLVKNGPSTNSNISRYVTKPLANAGQDKIFCNQDNVTEDKLEITPGRTNNSYNALYGGYQYSLDGKILNGYKSWRCIFKGCEGRIHSFDDKRVTVRQEHSHEPDLGDCISKVVKIEMKRLPATTQTTPCEIIAQTISRLPGETKVKLPSKQSLKRQIKYTRRQANQTVGLAEEVEDVSNTEDHSATDLSDILQTIVEDDPLYISGYDGSNLACTSGEETNTTRFCARDDNRVTESLPGAVAEENSTPLKRKRTIEEISTGLSPSTTSNSSRSVTNPPAIYNITQKVYRGYRYTKDGKILPSGYQSWRCITKHCKGRIDTHEDNHVTVKNEHVHKPDHDP